MQRPAPPATARMPVPVHDSAEAFAMALGVRVGGACSTDAGPEAADAARSPRPRALAVDTFSSSVGAR